MTKLGRKLTTLSQLVQVVSGNTREILAVPVDDVVSEAQVRKKFDNLQELADSLKVEGQQSPIIVSPRNADGKYVIQKGERRWRAAKLAGLPTIDLTVNSKNQTQLEAIAGQLIENIQRDDLTAMEIAEALGVLSDGGMRGMDIAQRIGKTSKYVSIHLALRSLSAPVQRLVDADVVADVELLYTLEQIAKLDLARCEAACELAQTTGITRRQAKELYQALKEQKASEASNAQGEVLVEQGQPANAVSPQSDTLPGANANADDTDAAPVPAQTRPIVDPTGGTRLDTSATAVQELTSEPTQAPKDENPFLTEEEKERKTKAKQPKADTAAKPVAGSYVIKVQLTDTPDTRGTLLLDRLVSHDAKAWVHTDDGRDIEVDLEALKITGITSTE